MQVKLGKIYRCSVCGAEVLVIRPGKESKLRPVCCNQPMMPMTRLAEMYRCPVCGAEVAILKSKSDSVRLVCCNVPMRLLNAKAA